MVKSLEDIIETAKRMLSEAIDSWELNDIPHADVALAQCVGLLCALTDEERTTLYASSPRWKELVGEWDGGLKECAEWNSGTLNRAEIYFKK